MFFLLQTLETLQKASEGVAPGTERTYYFLVFILCAACLALGYSTIRIYTLGRKELEQARQDYKELSDKSVVLMSKVEMHLSGQRKLEDKIDDIRLVITSIKDMLKP